MQERFQPESPVCQCATLPLPPPAAALSPCPSRTCAAPAFRKVLVPHAREFITQLLLVYKRQMEVVLVAARTAADTMP